MNIAFSDVGRMWLRYWADENGWPNSFMKASDDEEYPVRQNGGFQT